MPQERMKSGHDYERCAAELVPLDIFNAQGRRPDAGPRLLEKPLSSEISAHSNLCILIDPIRLLSDGWHPTSKRRVRARH